MNYEWQVRTAPEPKIREYMQALGVSRIMAAGLINQGLSIDEADKLFRLEGHSLEPESALLDAIVVDALKCGDDIGTFYATCDELNIKT